MICILLVSHSNKVAEGLAEMINQMVQANENVKIIPVGGTQDGSLGTDPMRIIETFNVNSEASEILVFCDLGSSIMSVESALDFLDDEIKKKIKLVDAPLVEGSFAAGAIATTTDDVDLILSQVEDAKNQKKFN